MHVMSDHIEIKFRLPNIQNRIISTPQLQRTSQVMIMIGRLTNKVLAK